MKQTRRIGRAFCRIWNLCLALLLILSCLVPYAFALDDDAYDGYMADTLTIEVGYFGGPYYEKRVFTAEELWNLPLVNEDYTFIDNMPSVVIDHVTGVRLDDLMAAAGIDVNSIETFYFWTRDKTSDYYTSYSKTELLDTTRYCYYSLPENFDYEEGAATEGADAFGTPVPTVMALADDWNRCIQGAEFGSDYMDLNTLTRFRLIFGQVDVSTRTANRSAKWVHKIEVQLGGAPTVTVDTADLDMEVGSVRRILAQVHAADSAVSAGASIQWSSSDETVATVDSEGNVTVVGEGSAVITAAYGSASTSFVVNGTKEAAEDPPDDPVPVEVNDNPDNDPAPDSGVMPSGGTSGGAGSDNTGSGGNTPAASPKKIQDSSRQDDTLRLQGVTLHGSGDNPLPSAGEAPATISDGEEDGGVQNWRIYEMSEAAQELPEIEADNPLLGFTGAASGGIFAAGGIVQYVLYRRRFFGD